MTYLINTYFMKFMKKTISLLLIVVTLTSYAAAKHAPNAEMKTSALYGMHYGDFYVADTGGVYDRLTSTGFRLAPK